MGILRVTIWVMRAITLPTKSPHPPSTGLSRQSVSLRNFHMRSIETRESAIRSKIGTSFTQKASSRGSTAPQPPQPPAKKTCLSSARSHTNLDWLESSGSRDFSFRDADYGAEDCGGIGFIGSWASRASIA